MIFLHFICIRDKCTNSRWDLGLSGSRFRKLLRVEVMRPQAEGKVGLFRVKKKPNPTHFFGARWPLFRVEGCKLNRTLLLEHNFPRESKKMRLIRVRFFNAKWHGFTTFHAKWGSPHIKKMVWIRVRFFLTQNDFYSITGSTHTLFNTKRYSI